MKLWRSCCNCYSFDMEREVCKKAGSRPPAPIIAKGCEEWEDDIPF